MSNLTPNNSSSEEESIEFPCVFPLKVMGINENDYPQFVLDITKKHVAGVDRDCVKTRESKSGKYISVTVTFMANNRKQLDALYLELNSSDRTKMAL